MKTRTKVIIAISIAIMNCILLIGKLFDKKVDNTLETQIEWQITSETTSTSINTTKTTKTTKKTTKKQNKETKVNVVKRTHKNTKPKPVKVASGTKGEYQNYAKQVGGYDDTQMSCLINLWNRESGWNANSVNKSSGACGIPQAYPCSKIKQQQGSNDWKAQIRWGINYISSRYKTPCNAWKHFQSKNWY